MNIVITILYFVLALFLLVTIHEAGHFMVARWCGVKVLRFSFGFGKVLAQWRDRSGTEYAWSLIPLGGYVKMLDEGEGPVDASEKHMAFNNQSIWAKIAIVLAGPLFNLLFAFVALWLVLVVGIQTLAPMIDGVTPGSIAANAGLAAKQEMISFDNKPISSWRDFQYALMPLLGSDESVPMTVKSMVTGEKSTLSLPIGQWKFDGKNTDILAALGIKPFLPSVPPTVGEVVDGSAAQVAGFQKDDRVTSVNGVVISDWIDLLDWVKNSPGKILSIGVKRGDLTLMLSAKVAATETNGHSVGMLGIRSKPVDWPHGWLRTQRQGPIDAIAGAFRQTADLTGATFSLIGRLATGKVSLKGISGPIGIAQGAGESARGGFSYYVSFLALISISLGVLNLLPIPILDGGHLLYYLLESIWRRPLSLKFKVGGMYLGFVFLMALMVLAFTNDLGRLVNQF